MYATYPASLRNTAPPEREGLFFGYVGAVCTLAIVLVAPRLADLARVVDHISPTFWLLAAFGVLADFRPLTSGGLRQSAIMFPSICFTFAILLAWGFPEAVLVQACAVVVSSIRLRHRPWRAAFNAAQYAVSFAASAAVLGISPGMPFAPGRRTAWVDVATAVAAAAAWFTVNQILVAMAVRLRFGDAWPATLRRTAAYDVLTTGSLLMLGPVLVGASRASASLIPMVIVPLLAVNRLARLSAERERAVGIDSLTGLANRNLLMSEVSFQASAASASHGRHRRARFALLVLDIDRFKHVNGALGHEVGDRLLVEIGQRIDRAARGNDVVARLGGDEFAVVVREIDSVGDAKAVAAKIEEVLSVPVVLDGLSLDVDASIGIAVFPEHGRDFATLMRHADVAMYEAKIRGDDIALYSSDADGNSPARLGLLADLRRALEQPDCDEVAFYYQPQVEMATGEVVGVEALLRWRHPERGLIDPEELIHVAEHSGVMRLLTMRAVDDVVGQLAKWRAGGIVLHASVNVSVRDLHSDEIVDRLADRLGECDVPPDQIQLEITESALMADPRRVLATLQRLAGLGVALSLDDFGTGYSSMQHLRRLPLAEVKIDRSFVLGMAGDPDDAAIVRSIIGLANSLGLRVVAEGVEDDRTRRMLLDAGCGVAQGWFYARPLPPDDLVSWLARYRPPQPWPPA